MKVELQINNSVSPNARFVSWAPSPCRIRMTNTAGAVLTPVNVTITGVSVASGGAVVFRKGATGAFSSSLTLAVPTNGTSVPFFVAGRFGRPSVNNGDVTIEARANLVLPISPGALVGAVKVMVRVRKNANTLTPGERDRFVAAFAQLNNQGAGRFADFRNMHTNVSSPQAHGAAGFLPWHRAYLLDLERELQAIDPSVSLPYWRFDQPAPNIFTLDYLGSSNAMGTVQFGQTNPLQFWTTDGVQGINRRPLFNTAVAPPGLLNEAQTLALGGPGNLYAAFRAMEGNPHGSAHVSFGGSISSIGTAAKDPLFFLLHCNVDRLWAKWQRLNSRFDAALAASYDSNPGNPIGHKLIDTMWPWNGITGPPRPPTAPGGALASSPCVSAPGPQPRVRSSLDYQGSVNALSREGFDYDDVRFA
ncbi:MAG: tyrosinase family protein [Acidobacteriota bacterium]